MTKEPAALTNKLQGKNKDGKRSSRLKMTAFTNQLHDWFKQSAKKTPKTKKPIFNRFGEI